MKSKKIHSNSSIISCILLGCLVVSLIIQLNSIIPIKDQDNRIIPQISSYTNYTAIKITGNENFTPANGVFQGDGSASNPYIIENFIISDTILGSCVQIIDTTKHVIIRNLILNGGIGIGNCTFITILNCSLKSSYIWCGISNDIHIENNTCESITFNGGGINSKIIKNTLGKNSIFNRCIYMMSLPSSITVKENILSDINGTAIFSAGKNHTIQDNIIINASTGIEMFCLNNSIVENNFITNCNKGIAGREQLNNTIQKNNITNCSIVGLELYMGNYNNITLNNVFDNQNGIWLNESSNFNKIWGNNFYFNLGNQTWASSNSNLNWWELSKPVLTTTLQLNIGNYYGDYQIRYPSSPNNGYTWSTRYIICGDSHSFDSSSLVEKYTSFLESPVLTTETNENVSTNGNIYLNWSSVNKTSWYLLYNSSSVIDSPDNLTPLITQGCNFLFSHNGNGTRYFAIIAVNPIAISELSNCLSVIVAIPPSNSSNTSPPNTENPSPDLPPIVWQSALIAGGGVALVGAVILIYKRKQSIIF